MMETIGLLAELMIYIALLVTTIYAVIFGYHWYSYGSSRTVSTTALIIFLAGAAIFVGSMLVSYQLF